MLHYRHLTGTAMEYPNQPIDVDELLNRLEASFAAGRLSGADRILEFPAVLRALRQSHLKSSVDSKSYKRIVSLLEQLLETLIPYKQSYADPNAKTFYRVSKQKEFTQLVPVIKDELSKLKDSNA